MEKVVWITGGGTGIGRALCLEYAKYGFQVVISGRRLDRLESVSADSRSFSGSVFPMVCDVTDEQQILDVIKEIKNRFHRLDIVIANAGYAQTGQLEDASIEDWHRQLNVNVIGAAKCATNSLPLLRETIGRVVFISSVMAYVRFPRSGLYSASKAALTAIGETLQLELDSGVSCTIIHPGFVESEIGQIDSFGRYDSSATDHRPKRFMWSAEDAARVMIKGIRKRKSHLTITRHGIFGLHMARLFPRLVLWIQRNWM